MKLKKRILQFTTLFVIILILSNCAQQGSPTGGPRDKTPPKMIMSKPANNSVNFKGKKLEMTFDEYIQLKDVDKELIISPAFKKKPDISVKGKKIVIEFKEDLKDSVTYNFNFRKAVTDLNEGNLYKNFQFSFSTGPNLDTMQIAGNVRGAFDLKTEPEQLVMLYRNYSDSTPTKTVPDYLTRTDSGGNFTLYCIRPEKYRIFMLKDGNTNLMWDQPSELIAWKEDIYNTSAEVKTVSDTIKIPVIKKKKNGEIDTTFRDSAYTHPKTFFYPNDIQLFSYQEESYIQYLKDNSRKLPYKIQLVFNKPIKDSVSIIPINFTPQGKWFTKENSIKNDSVVYWITDSTIYNRDTLKFVTRYQKLDSLKNFISNDDTLTLSYTKKKIKPVKEHKKEKNKTKPKPKNLLTLNQSVNNGGNLDKGRDLVFTADQPLAICDASKIILEEKKDSVFIPLAFTVERDSINLRRVRIKTKWKDETKYRIFCDTATFVSIYNYSLDTIKYEFSSQKLEYYGNIFLNVSNITQPTIIQLLTEKEDIVQQYFVETNKKIDIKLIKPGKYKLKAILDMNNNKKWDLGDYFKKFLPEKVFYFKKSIEIKSNWDNELDWEIGKD